MRKEFGVDAQAAHRASIKQLILDAGQDGFLCESGGDQNSCGTAMSSDPRQRSISPARGVTRKERVGSAGVLLRSHFLSLNGQGVLRFAPVVLPLVPVAPPVRIELRSLVVAALPLPPLIFEVVPVVPAPVVLLVFAGTAES